MNTNNFIPLDELSRQLSDISYSDLHYLGATNITSIRSCIINQSIAPIKREIDWIDNRMKELKKEGVSAENSLIIELKRARDIQLQMLKHRRRIALYLKRHSCIEVKPSLPDLQGLDGESLFTFGTDIVYYMGAHVKTYNHTGWISAKSLSHGNDGLIHAIAFEPVTSKKNLLGGRFLSIRRNSVYLLKREDFERLPKYYQEHGFDLYIKKYMNNSDIWDTTYQELNRYGIDDNVEAAEQVNPLEQAIGIYFETFNQNNPRVLSIDEIRSREKRLAKFLIKNTEEVGNFGKARREFTKKYL